MKIHRNLGHPNNKELARALKHAGAKRHIIRWALKSLRCPVCETRKQPAAHRPGALPRDLGFNTTIGLDTVEFNEGTFKKTLLNII